MSENKEYDEFVEKFKPKKTTDDCYTPEPIYEFIKNKVCKDYNLDESKIVRPFYPGGDYENFDYSGDKVVVDNPPFSIIGNICKYYERNNILFYLFAPHLTLLTSSFRNVGYIIVGATITYENGAKVNTSFITNLGNFRGIKTDAEIYNFIVQYQRNKNMLPKYVYPRNLHTSLSIDKIVKKGFDIEIPIEKIKFLSSLDSQKPFKKGVFGRGFLVSDEYAEKLEKLEKFEKLSGNEIIEWELSEREKQIIEDLNIM